jgi:hypothetical protein
LIVFLLLRQHWGWQPPYHLVYLQPPDWYEPSIGEYLVPHMPLYPAFLRIVAELRQLSRRVRDVAGNRRDGTPVG